MASLSDAKSSEIERKVNNFLEYLEIERGSSPLTLRNYRHYLSRFVNWLKREKISLKLGDINPELVRQYRVYLSRLPSKPAKLGERTLTNKASSPEGGTLGRNTQGYHVIALRSFLRWLIKNDHKVMSPDKIDLPKTEDRQIKFMTGEQVGRLLNAPSLSTIQGQRDKAILEVLYSTGLRVSELAKLNRDKIDLERREFGIVGKGGRARVVFLSLRAAEWVKKYLKVRRDHFNPLFIRHKGKVEPTTSDESMRLTPRSVQRMIKKYARKIKLSVDATPHIIRHSFATDLLMAGADIRSVQEMLGHKNIQTTQIYTHVTHKHLKDIHSAFHGKGGK